MCGRRASAGRGPCDVAHAISAGTTSAWRTLPQSAPVPAGHVAACDARGVFDRSPGGMPFGVPHSLRETVVGVVGLLVMCVFGLAGGWWMVTFMAGLYVLCTGLWTLALGVSWVGQVGRRVGAVIAVLGLALILLVVAGTAGPSAEDEPPVTDATGTPRQVIAPAVTAAATPRATPSPTSSDAAPEQAPPNDPDRRASLRSSRLAGCGCGGDQRSACAVTHPSPDTEIVRVSLVLASGTATVPQTPKTSMTGPSTTTRRSPLSVGMVHERSPTRTTRRPSPTSRRACTSASPPRSPPMVSVPVGVCAPNVHSRSATHGRRADADRDANHRRRPRWRRRRAGPSRGRRGAPRRPCGRAFVDHADGQWRPPGGARWTRHGGLRRLRHGGGSAREHQRDPHDLGVGRRVGHRTRTALITAAPAAGKPGRPQRRAPVGVVRRRLLWRRVA